ncbi:MAG: hydroxylamine reductase [Firmicutes bacterium]|uniref:hydroxylamine reductase n=1 Tax=Lentihominibacter sp. TaxID=2944216 RepID=UPI002A548DA7|nr:hydroxylamine reductase [Lentihominibacter sp.]MDD7319539.1 hydroxylamine reductase [Bacillota bacterium]MDY5286598.1 hydroxylamine reductase [Lentihominibacter sp.]
MEKKMFCYQCQEAAGGKGCTHQGVCGKQPETAKLQDLLVYVTKGLASVLCELRKSGAGGEHEEIPHAVNHLITRNLFATITNANFDDDSLKIKIKETLECKEKYLQKLKGAKLCGSQAEGGACGEPGEHAGYRLPDAALWNGPEEEYLQKAEHVGVLSTENEDVRSLREMITYGLKGLSAYLTHANTLHKESGELEMLMQKALADTLDDALTVEDLVDLTIETGKYGVSAMALLDQANTDAYGNPEITEVDLGTRNRPGILISGHDLRDMELLLEQTKDTGVDVYTHSEMLPAAYYPAFKKYDHYAGNYGNAWWQQRDEFEKFNGPILMTTNCIVPPKDSYKKRLFTTGSAYYPGCPHIDGRPHNIDGVEKDFSEIIQLAKKCPPPDELEQGKIIGGFAHEQVMALADKVVDAVKSGDIRKFVVMAGCDGRMPSREYYTEFAKRLPGDVVILTAGCAKYRYNKLHLGDINGIPRILDAGQCNDSYSLAVIALKLKEIFGVADINDLPIVYNIAWYEQKAVIVLLALLSLGIKNIHLGPTLPAFLSPNTAKVLVERFGIAGIGTADEDLELFFY